MAGAFKKTSGYQVYLTGAGIPEYEGHVAATLDYAIILARRRWDDYTAGGFLATLEIRRAGGGDVVALINTEGALMLVPVSPKRKLP